jgi:hypothetical protein
MTVKMRRKNISTNLRIGYLSTIKKCSSLPNVGKHPPPHHVTYCTATTVTTIPPVPIKLTFTTPSSTTFTPISLASRPAN